jgi:protein-L-isoaspartate(D-aspartate) O-methyltransferase
MAEIAGKQGKVVTVDIDAEVATRARANLVETGYPDVTVVCGDGTFGYPPGAPYDRIVVTVGAGDIPPALRQQLRPEGRLVVPLSLRGPQRSIAFRRLSDVLVGLSIVDCDLSTAGRGEFAGRTPPLAVGRGLWLWWDGARSIDGATIERLLSNDYQEIATGRAATIAEIFGGLYLWLALRDPRFVQLGSAENVHVPWVLGLPGKLRLTAGLTDATAFCVLSTGRAAPATTFADDRLLPLSVRGFGDAALARALVDLIGAWDRAHRPATSGLRVTVFPLESGYSPSPDELVIDKRWSRLVLRW